MAVTQYIGARYVPLFADPAEWDNTRAYEPLTIVLYQGDSYTSAQAVPVGIDITNTEFWKLTGNYNAQIETYRAEVEQFEGRITDNAEAIATEQSARESADSSLGERIDAEQSARESADAANATAIETEKEEREASDASIMDDIASVLDRVEREGFTAKVHQTQGSNDTSYMIVEIPRDKVVLEIHNLSGDDSDPKALAGNAFSYAESHSDAFIVTNANYGGADYPCRFNGTDYAGEVLTRPYLAFTANGEPAFFPIGTVISAIPSEYPTAYACDTLLIDNGRITQDLSSDIFEPRQVFGWSDSAYYIMFCEGRGTMQKGLSLAELAIICSQFGMLNAVNLDGGGSTCTAVNASNGTIKVNHMRDFALPFDQLRATGLGHVYKLKEGISNDVLDEAIAQYRSLSNGYEGYFNYLMAAQTQALDPTVSTRNIPNSTSRSEKLFNQYRFAPDYEYDGTMSLPIPIKRYQNECVRVKADAELSFPANAVASDSVISIAVARYTDGARQTATRRRVSVKPSAAQQFVDIDVDTSFIVNKTNNPNERAQDEYKLEFTVVSGSISAMNLESAWMRVEFAPEIV